MKPLYTSVLLAAALALPAFLPQEAEAQFIVRGPRGVVAGGPRGAVVVGRPNYGGYGYSNVYSNRYYNNGYYGYPAYYGGYSTNRYYNSYPAYRYGAVTPYVNRYNTGYRYWR